MPLIVPDVAEPIFLQQIVANLFGAGIRLRLYSNNYTPADNSALGNFTEATFSGYAAAAPSMSAAAEVANKASSNDSLARVFSHNGGGVSNTIYGYYVTVLGGGGDLLWAERFPAPIVMSAAGSTISIQLFFTLDSFYH